MDPSSILIIGNYGAGNLGDDAILGGILTELRVLGYQGKIRVTHGGINSSREIYKGLEWIPFVPAGFRSSFKRSRKQTLEAIKASDHIIFGGGGLFCDAESRWAPYIWARQAAAVRKMKKPYLIYGQSIGPLRSFLSSYWAKTVFRHAQAIHVRDEESAKLLKKWGLKATLGTDSAFSWLLSLRRNIPKKPIILVAFRLWPSWKSREWEPLIKEIKVFAQRRKLKPILISMDLANRAELLALQATGLEIYEPQSARDAFEGFEKASLAVTMRLHAGIFSLVAGTPFVALSYSNKVANLFKPLDIKGSFRLLAEQKLEGKQFREALKELRLSPPPQCNLESLLFENQRFLAEHLS